MRAPSERRLLFAVCEGIISVISTAWVWCRIMACMNSTSAADRGGRLALVEGGSVLVGIPGAPGCTTTGFVEAACRERATEGSNVKEHKVTIKEMRRLTIPGEKPNFRSQGKRNCLQRVEWESFIRQSTEYCHKTLDCTKLSETLVAVQN